MNNKIVATFIASIALISGSARAEDLNQIFTKINQYVQEKNYSKAMEELGWAKKELEKLHQGRLAEILPAEVNGFTGAAPEFTSMMGFTNIERQYKSGDKSIKVAITGSSGNEGLGGLAGLAKMGMMMGGAQPGTEQFRIDGRTANLTAQAGSRPELTVILESGSMITISAENGVDAATLKKFGEGLKLSDLDDYLKGGK